MLFEPEKLANKQSLKFSNETVSALKGGGEIVKGIEKGSGGAGNEPREREDG